MSGAPIRVAVAPKPVMQTAAKPARSSSRAVGASLAPGVWTSCPESSSLRSLTAPASDIDRHPRAMAARISGSVRTMRSQLHGDVQRPVCAGETQGGVDPAPQPAYPKGRRRDPAPPRPAGRRPDP